MRTPFLLLPITLATLASMPALAQEAPRVIFCTGSCFAVDQNGVRTPAPKGTTLREGQRLETGPSAYAQLKLGADAAVGVGERAQVRFDQTSVRGRDIVILDQGRIRMLGGEALGKAATRGVELRTFDGIFALRNADIEVRTPPPLAGGIDASLTVVKLNAGDARLVNPQGDIAIARDGVQGFTTGKIVTDKPISLADIALAPSRPGIVAATPTALLPEPIRNLNLPAPTLPLPGPTVRPDIFGPVLPLPGVPLTVPNPRMVPVPPLTRADLDLGGNVIDPTTRQPASLYTALRNITSGAVTTVQPPLLSGTTINLSSPVTTTVATSSIQTTTPILTPGITTTLSSPLTLVPVGGR
jgi:hypothetical protein